MYIMPWCWHEIYACFIKLTTFESWILNPESWIMTYIWPSYVIIYCLSITIWFLDSHSWMEPSKILILSNCTDIFYKDLAWHCSPASLTYIWPRSWSTVYQLPVHSIWLQVSHSSMGPSSKHCIWPVNYCDGDLQNVEATTCYPCN